MIYKNIWALHIFQSTPMGQGYAELLYHTEEGVDADLQRCEVAMVAGSLGTLRFIDAYARTFLIRVPTIIAVLKASYQGVNMFRVDAEDTAKELARQYRPGQKTSSPQRLS